MTQHINSKRQQKLQVRSIRNLTLEPSPIILSLLFQISLISCSATQSPSLLMRETMNAHHVQSTIIVPETLSPTRVVLDVVIYYCSSMHRAGGVSYTLVNNFECEAFHTNASCNVFDETKVEDTERISVASARRPPRG